MATTVYLLNNNGDYLTNIDGNRLIADIYNNAGDDSPPIDIHDYDDHFINYRGLSVYHEELLRLLKKMQQADSITEIEYADSYLSFPTIGTDGHLYIDTTRNKTYRWDSAGLKYIVVGSDYEDIKVIDGNF